MGEVSLWNGFFKYKPCIISIIFCSGVLFLVSNLYVLPPCLPAMLLILHNYIFTFVTFVIVVHRTSINTIRYTTILSHYEDLSDLNKNPYKKYLPFLRLNLFSKVAIITFL